MNDDEHPREPPLWIGDKVGLADQFPQRSDRLTSYMMEVSLADAPDSCAILVAVHMGDFDLATPWIIETKSVVPTAA